MRLLNKIIRLPSLFLIIILLIAFVLRVNNLNYNSPFLDEAMHIKLGKKVLADSWAEEAPFSWVGGLPLFYPRLSAYAYKVGGILGSRFLNVLLGTFSVYLFYLLTKLLYLTDENENNEYIAGFSALLLSILAVPVFLSRLAVYDMLSFTLFLASLLFLQKALVIIKPILWQRENYFFASFIFLFTSFLAKYTTIIYVPLFSFWAFFQSKKRGRFVLHRSLKYFILPLTVSILLYLGWNFDSLRQFLANQFNEPTDQSFAIINEFLDFTLVLLPFSFLGLSLLFIKGHRNILLLTLGILIVPVFHLLTNNLSSLYQHVFLSLIFLIPPLTFLLSRIESKGAYFIKMSAALLILILVFFRSQSQIKNLETSWTNSNSVMEFLKNNSNKNDIILSSEDDITDLALPDTPSENINGFWSLDYQDKKDEEAYSRAILDGYFNLILLNEKSSAKNLKIVTESINERYQLIYDSSPFKVYRLII